MSHIAILLPCYNEELTLGKVIDDFRRVLPEARLVVIDNNSTDRSIEIALSKGVDLLRESRQGKGFVMQKAFEEIDADLYVMVDSDDTYPADAVHSLVEPVEQGKCDMAIGTRLEHADTTTLRPLHQFGNWLFLKIINIMFRQSIHDLMSGYRVLSRRMVETLPLLSAGYEIETELTLQALEKHFRILEIPIVYRARPVGSQSKLRSFRDGWKIIRTIASMLRDHRPMTFFGLLALFFFLLGLAVGSLVIVDYLEDGLVQRTPSAIFSTLLVILAAISFISGLIVATINRRVRELSVLLHRRSRSR